MMSSRPPTRSKTIIAVAGGKGGVGKTIITANLAVALARALETRGKKVLAMDLDLGCGNLNSCLGVRLPPTSINDYLFDRVKNLEEILIPTDLNNLKLVSCSYKGSDIIQLNEETKQRLVEDIRYLDVDFVLLDLAAGVTAEVLDFFMAADEKVIVTTPESLSLHNAFVFLKSAIYRALWRELEREKFLMPIKTKLEEIVQSNGVLNMEQVLVRLKHWDRFSAYIVAGIVEELKPKLIFNMFRGEADKKHLINFCHLVKKYLDRNIEYLGAVAYDDQVRASVQELKPLLLCYPETEAAGNLSTIATKLLAS